MSTVIIVAPLVVTSWPLIVSAITASISALGYAVAANEMQQHIDECHENQRVSEEIVLENSEILADARNRNETLVVAKDNIKAVFHRDARGALRLSIEAVGLSKNEIRRIGEELIGRVTQQYAYNRLVTEMKERGMTIVEENVEEDDTVRIRVRNY